MNSIRRSLSILTVLIILWMVYTMAGCREDDRGPVDKLPPATQEGKNTFGCLINGKAWQPEGYDGTSNLDISYDPTYPTYEDGGAFDISAYKILNDKDKQFMYIYTIGVKSKGKYSLNDIEQGASTYFDLKTSCDYNREPGIYRNGSLTITKFDLQNQIISGTFEFTLAKPDCDTVRVTEGRFDMKI